VTLAIGLGQLGRFAPAQSVIRWVCQENPGALANLTALPVPDVIDGTQAAHLFQHNAQFFVQLAPYSLFRALAFLNAAAGRTMKTSAGTRVVDFRNEEHAFALENTQGRLSGLDHGCANWKS